MIYVLRQAAKIFSYCKASYIATYRKKLEELVFVEEEFLYKKISKKGVYVDYGATAVVPQIAVMLYGDLTALK